MASTRYGKTIASCYITALSCYHNFQDLTRKVDTSGALMVACPFVYAVSLKSAHQANQSKCSRQKCTAPGSPGLPTTDLSLHLKAWCVCSSVNPSKPILTEQHCSRGCCNAPSVEQCITCREGVLPLHPDTPEKGTEVHTRLNVDICLS